MTKYVRLEGNVVAEVFETDLDITELFHPSVRWTVVPSDVDVKVGYLYGGGYFAIKQKTPEELAYQEKAWRAEELARADVELGKVQDSDPKAVGTVGDWRTYRKELRAMPESEGFPTSHVRPVAPDAK